MNQTGAWIIRSLPAQARAEHFTRAAPSRNVIRPQHPERIRIFEQELGVPGRG